MPFGERDVDTKLSLLFGLVVESSVPMVFN